MLSSRAYEHYSHSELLLRLTALLEMLSPLWRLRTFDCSDLPWAEHFPELACVVNAINDDELDNIDANSERLLRTLLPALKADLAQADTAFDEYGLESLLGICLPRPLPVQSLNIDDKELAHFSAHIKGRKWQQITDFVLALPFASSPECEANSAELGHISPESVVSQSETSPSVLEWCAGKGHLGRLLAKSTGLPVVSLEWQQALCDAGESFAQRWQLPQEFICGDAFNAPTELFTGSSHAVALHACGDLHISLLKQGAKAGMNSISISPCCYHLIRDNQYQPLSVAAKATGFELSKQELQLPLQHSVIASDTANLLRNKEMAWRLGFDRLQREVRNEDTYLPLPTIKQSQLSGSFTEFVRWGAQRKQLELPSGLEVAGYEAIGTARLGLVRRLDLVAHLLRGPLEHWLLLDRVCFLEEQGYEVNIRAFCDQSVTPRNALIQARKTQA
ncbi:SAM-dependent methyltransferase [Shewanella corallii]|uniref:SAM-dependent methyltransferase n=1 Tax=Shewanella corallii TaxID=560080 RepID=A0ABT0N428_9GAMM|nr:SAM-dependent methyltransferase [Shewanella corallii]